MKFDLRFSNFLAYISFLIFNFISSISYLTKEIYFSNQYYLSDFKELINNFFYCYI